MSFKRFFVIFLVTALFLSSFLSVHGAPESYSENFSSDSAMKDIETFGSAYVENGALVLNGNTESRGAVYAMLPFEADGDFVFTFDLDASDVDEFDTAGVVFGEGVESGSYRVLFGKESIEVVYSDGDASWQTVAIREFNKYTVNGGMAFSASVAVKNENLYVCVNGKAVLECALRQSTLGKVGFEAYGATVHVDNVSIKAEKYRGGAVSSSYTENIYIPKTGIKNPPSVISYDGEAYTPDSPRPSVIIYRVKVKGGQLVSELSNGTSYPLGERYALYKDLAVSGFSVYDEESAEALGKWLDENGVNDGYVISSKSEYIKAAIGTNPYLRGCLDATQSVNVNADELYEKARAASCNTVIISGRISKKTVFSLQSRLLTVFSVCVDNSKLSIYNCLQSGCNGIIGNAGEVISYMESITVPTVIRTPVICTEGGNIAVAPKNTQAAITSALDAGACAVVTDVCITDDGIPVLSDTDETVYLEKKVSIFNTPLKELRKLKYTDPRVANQTIATLEEMLLLMKNNYPDAVLRVRLSNESQACATAVWRVANELDMTQKVMIISHSPAFVKYVNDTLDIKANSSYTPYATANNGAGERVCYFDGYLNRLNSAYIGNKGIVPSSMLPHLSARGLTVHPYGVEKDETEIYFAASYNGFSLFDTSVASDIVMGLLASINENGTVTLQAQTYSGKLTDVTERAQFMLLGGTAEYNGDTVIGEGDFAFSYNATLPDGGAYTVYSESMSLKKSAQTPDAGELTDKGDVLLRDMSKYVTMGVGALTVAAGLVLFYILRKKNKSKK